MRRAVLPIIGAAVVAGGTLLWVQPGPTPDVTAHPVTLPAAASAVPDYAAEVHALDELVARTRQRTERDPRSWLGWAALASAYRSRSIVTGIAGDLPRAQAALDQAFTIAGPDAGPFLERARLNATCHRYGAIAADVDAVMQAVPGDDHDQADALALRASMDAACGRYAEAREGYARSVALVADPVTLCTYADLMESLGERARADALMAKAEQRAAALDADRTIRSWIAVQHGLMARDRGDWEGAEGYYRAAAAILPGWWQCESRRAELAGRRGDHDQAIAGYQELVRRSGNPALMDALAHELRARGRQDEGATWSSAARTVYEAMLLDAPEAAYGHALDHFLAAGTEPARTIDLAERNHRLRPGGEATVKLAQAYLAGGRLDEARAMVTALLATPYTTAAAHAVAAAVFAACGDAPSAAAERARATALDPHA